MKYFNIAADFKEETIDQYEALNQKYADSKVVETFGQISINNMYGSGRPGDMMPKTDMQALEKYVSYSSKKNINFSYTMNALCLSNREFTEAGLRDIKGFLSQLSDMGIHSLTVAIPAVIDFVHRTNFKFEIKASTLCDITNANKAVAYKELGADRIVVHESINRDFDALRSIREAYGPNTEVITNVICHKSCIFRPFHQIQGSHDTDPDTPSPRYYSHKCMMRRASGLHNYMNLNWIRPEDIKYYTQIGINRFKIQGRQTVVQGNPVKVMESYMKESYDGNLMELLDMFNPSNSFQVYIDNKKLDGFIDAYVKNSKFCKNDCQKCGYCMKYAERSMDVNRMEEVSGLMKRFYEEFDTVSTMMNSIASK